MTGAGPGLFALAFALGVRHGTDADHLAAIDALTRDSHVGAPRLAPYCGAWFAAGHSALVVVLACSLSLLAQAWTPPGWLEGVGKSISAIILVGLGVYNIRVALRPGGSAAPVGLRSSAFSRLFNCTRAWQVALVGALFALSFDSFALGALFAASSAGSWGTLVALGAALSFSVGMVSVDTANGVWLHRLLSRACDNTPRGLRAMTFAVGATSAVVGLAVGLSLAFPGVDGWLATHELAVSVGVVASIAAGYVAAHRLPAARATG